jgi:hypothetical protein
MVKLNFRDRTIADVVRHLTSRSGKSVSVWGTVAKGLGGISDTSWRDRRVSLEAPEAVPFWEAIDRLSAAGRVGYRLATYGDLGAESTGVVFEGPAEPRDDPVQYSGPFRVSLAGVHQHREVVFVKGAWVQVYPSGYAVLAPAAELATTPRDGGPLYAEIRVMAEPGLICRRNGPLSALEAADDRGRSLAGPPVSTSQEPWVPYSVFEGGISPPLRLPLQRQVTDPKSKSIRRISGKIPVELARVRARPALEVPLSDSEGKRFEGGGFFAVVKTSRTRRDGTVKLALTVGEVAKADVRLQSARSLTLMRNQFRLVDSLNRPARFTSSGAGGDGPGKLKLTFEYRPNPNPASGPPTALQLFDLDRTEWEIPFEFRDVALP